MNKMTKTLLGAAICAILATSGCSSNRVENFDKVNDQYTAAISWMQNSTEYRALCYQAFNAAYAHLKQVASIKRKKNAKPLAVVMDLDETVLSNTRAFVAMVRNSKSFNDYSAALQEWQSKGKPEIIPGAQQFIKQVNNLGIKLFFVTNRTCDSIGNTESILQIEGISYDNPIFCRATVLDKSPRFVTITDAYDVAAYIGDQVTDFPTLTNDMGSATNLDRGSPAASQMGINYFILPNPVYGAWLKKVHPDYFSLSPDGAQKAMRNSIKP
ncbi:MAG: hypothetical protein K6F05_04910 [Succinivibrio sp.]|nr:hypothetical protein [Succinivibrio sp.]